MVDAFSVFLSIDEISLIFLLVGIDKLAFPRSLVILPLSIVDSSAGILKHSSAILPILHPVPDVFLTILEIIHSFAVLLSIEPISFIPLIIGIDEGAKTMLSVLVPLSLIDGSTPIVIHSFAMFLAIDKLALIPLPSEVDIDAIR